MDTLTIVSLVSLLISGICTIVIIIDLLTGHRQSMGIMNTDGC